MSTRAQRRERAQSRRRPDPVADRSAAAEAIYADYDVKYQAAAKEAQDAVMAAWMDCDRKWAEAWEERCRRLAELEEREVARTAEEAAAAKAVAAEEELERELEEDAGTDRLMGDLRVPAGESIGAQQERADIEESGL